MQQENLEGFRLSPQQRHLWHLQQAGAHQPYCVQSLVQIEGVLELPRLTQAIEQVIERHEILRTTFRCLPGMVTPLQFIAHGDGCHYSLQQCQLNDMDAHTQESSIEALFYEQGQQPFDLEHGPLLRATLVTLSRCSHLLLVSLPALCADTATLKKLMSAISHAYETGQQNEQSSDEVMQYADLAEWQNELLEGNQAEPGRAYWRQLDIAGALTTRLPFELHLAENDGFVPAVVKVQVCPELVTNITGPLADYETSLPVFLLACWQVLLWRLTGQANIVVGTAYDGRKYEELESALGPFAKYLPLRCHLAGSLRLKDVLEQVNTAASNAYKRQEYFTWEQAIGTTDGLSETSLFASGFDFEELPASCAVGDVTFSMLRLYACTHPFKVRLACVRSGDELILEFHYDMRRLAADDINRLSQQFLTLLQSASPAALIDELEILGEDEREYVLFTFNSTKADYPQQACFHQLFEEQAEATPGHIALVFGSERITYTELNARANQVAHYLRALGVGPEVLVGIAMERSPELMVGLLGILKAGAAYVPLDLSYPAERIAFMMRDAQMHALLTQERLLAKLPAREVQIVCLDRDRETISEQLTINPDSGVLPAHLAYVIYTSGSTGRPKSVMIPHQGLVNYLNWCAGAYTVVEGQGTLVHSPIGFDLTVTSLFSPLLRGQQVTMLPEDEGVDTLATVLGAGEDFSLVKVTPTHLELLSRLLSSETIALRVRALIIGGEALRQEQLDFWRTHAPETRLINEYGPTEAVVGCCAYEVPAAAPMSGEVPIGRPIANMQLYVLDAHLRPTPISVPGELYIGGVGVARGYLNHPALTAERFIPHPFSTEPGARLYNTGDIARHLSDGNLEFLGRADHQVKVRGYRIELGEIETVLLEHAAIQQAVVLMREDVPGTKQLVGYLVAEQQAVPSTSGLRRFLLQKLPEYMLPAAFVFLDTLPLTPTGKVDSRALPPVGSLRPKLERAYELPGSRVEQQLAEIWSQVLGIDTIGIHDNFFELGGDSILSIQIIDKARHAGLRITLKQLVQHPTVAELATAAEPLVTLQAEQGIIIGPVPLTPIQHWFFEMDLPERHHWNQAMLLEGRQGLDPLLIKRAVSSLLRWHDALRMRFLKQENGWRQINAEPDEAVPFTLVDLSALPDVELETVIERASAELQANLHLTEGPLLRVAFFDLGPHRPCRVLIVLHHLVVDGISWRILLEDLQTACGQLSYGDPVQLPPKTTSFKQWAQLLTEYAQSPQLRSELSYWLAEQRASVTPLPLDFALDGEMNTEASARTVSLSLDAEETLVLLQEVPRAYHTQVNDVLLTALAEAFASWTGSRTLLVDLEGHGREDIIEGVNLSHTVGWLSALFPVLLDLGTSDGPGQALKAIKEQLRQVPGHGVGYGLLRYLSGEGEIAARLRTQSRAGVVFNNLGQFHQDSPETALFKDASESTGSTRSLRSRRAYLIEVMAFVNEEQLHLHWTYCEQAHRHSTITRVAERYMQELRALIAHCQSPDAGGYTPSDFPLTNLDERRLHRLSVLLDSLDEVEEHVE